MLRNMIDKVAGGPLRRSRLEPFAGNLSRLLFDNARMLVPVGSDDLKRTVLDNAHLRRETTARYQSKSFDLKIDDKTVPCKIRNGSHQASITMRLPVEGFPRHKGFLVSERFVHGQKTKDKDYPGGRMMAYDEEEELRALAGNDYGGPEAHRPGLQMVFSMPGTLTDLVLDGLIGTSINQIADLPEIIGKALADQRIVECFGRDDRYGTDDRIIIITRNEED